MGQGQTPGMKGAGYGSMPGHHFAMMSGIPAPYRSVNNPLSRKAETVEHGGRIYAENCAPCHGPTSAGDGAAGRDLLPPPGNLAWLSQMPMVQWDPFMYGTVAESGVQFKTAMPAFKDQLSKDVSGLSLLIYRLTCLRHPCEASWAGLATRSRILKI